MQMGEMLDERSDKAFLIAVNPNGGPQELALRENGTLVGSSLRKTHMGRPII
jgi:hypothetical protein